MSVWTPALLAVYCICGIFSLIGSVFVAISIQKFGAATLTTRLVLYLHLSQIIQDVVAFPYVYNSNYVVCAIAGWLHIYSGMSNIVCVAIMIIAYRHMFFEDKHKISEFCSNHCAALVFGFPLISALPFTTHSYGRIHNELCSFNGHGGLANEMWQGGFYLWSITIFFGCVGVTYVTIAEVYRTDKALGSKLMKSVMLYALATLVFWIPRCVFQAIEEDDYNIVISAYFLIFAAGVAYSLIFLKEKNSLKLFEQHAANERQTMDSIHNGDSIDGGDTTGFSFSFDEGSPYDRSSRMSSNNTAALSFAANTKPSPVFRESTIINMRNNPTKQVMVAASPMASSLTSTINPIMNQHQSQNAAALAASKAGAGATGTEGRDLERSMSNDQM